MNPSGLASEHRPALLAQVLRALIPCAHRSREACLFVDATYGRGGHARGLLSCLGPFDRLVVLDRDPEAVEHARRWASSEPRVLVLKGRFGDIRKLIESKGLGPVDALLVDLGVSSTQLDNASRGFSFRFPGPLDMRMDNSQGETLGDWLESVDCAELRRVLIELGEVPPKSASRIAEAITSSRRDVPLSSTADLAALVRPLVVRPKRRSQAGRDSATGVFQALRMHLNEELDELNHLLDQGFELLREQGRMAVISFHSLEDRMVKQRFRRLVMGDPALAKLPVPGSDSRALSVVRLAVPEAEEVGSNPRSRSARLRVIEKCSIEMAA